MKILITTLNGQQIHLEVENYKTIQDKIKKEDARKDETEHKTTNN